MDRHQDPRPVGSLGTVTGVNALSRPRSSFERRLLQTNLAISMTKLAAFILRHRIGIISTILLLVLDQAAKLAVVRVIPLGESWPTAGFLHLTHTRNLGSTLDLFSGHTIALIVGSTICITMLMALYWPRPKTGARPQVAFGLMLAGALGNLIDRVVFGHVIDFIDIVP